MSVNLLLLFFCALAIFCSAMVIISKNPIHSILYLILVFCNITFVLIILGAEFIAITFLIVYVGAIAVLFLFVVMMLNIKIIELEESFWRYIPVGLIISSIFLFQLFHVVFNFNILDAYNLFFYNAPSSVKLISFFTADDRFVIVSDAHSNFVNLNYELTNTELLGWLVYTYNFFVFLIISLILFVSMIGSIILVLNQNINIKRQIIFRQVLRDLKSSVSLKK